MAITRLWQSGFETNSLKEISTSSNNLSVSSATARTGTYSLRYFDTSQVPGGTIVIPSTYQLRTGWMVYRSSAYANDAFRQPIGFINGGTDIAHLRGRVLDYKLTTGGTVRDTAVGGVLTGWQHVGIDLKIDASGWINLYLDGILAANWSGNTGSTPITTINIVNTWNIGTTYFDDMYIDDTTGEGAAAVLPILRFPYLSPDGNGNYAQWDGSDLDSTDNYLLIDEIPPSTSDYLETNVADEYDSHTMTTYSLDTGETINAVIPTVYAERAGSSEKIALGTRLSSTDSIGSDQDMGISPAFIWERQTTKPGGGSWAQADLDGFEAVIKSRGSY